MTPEKEALVLALVWYPGRPPSLSPKAFLKRYGAKDGVQLGLDLLNDAFIRQDAGDVELALVVCSVFEMSSRHLDLLIRLAFADWHVTHEGVVRNLQKIKPPASAIPALVHLAKWVPDYLEYDEFRALATNAIWALGTIDGPEARMALESLTHDSDDIVSSGARHQLER